MIYISRKAELFDVYPQELTFNIRIRILYTSRMIKAFLKFRKKLGKTVKFYSSSLTKKGKIFFLVLENGERKLIILGKRILAYGPFALVKIFEFPCRFFPIYDPTV